MFAPTTWNALTASTSAVAEIADLDTANFTKLSADKDADAAPAENPISDQVDTDDDTIFAPATVLPVAETVAVASFTE